MQSNFACFDLEIARIPPKQMMSWNRRALEFLNKAFPAKGHLVDIQDFQVKPAFLGLISQTDVCKKVKPYRDVLQNMETIRVICDGYNKKIPFPQIGQYPNLWVTQNLFKK